MPDDSADTGDDADTTILERWRDLEQPFGDPEESDRIPEVQPLTNADTEELDVATLSHDLSNVDSDLLNTFTICVLLAKLGILLVSVGVLLAVFRGLLQIGVGLVVVGSLTLLRLWQYYRSYTDERDTKTESDTETVSNADPVSDSEGSAIAAPDNTDDSAGHNR